MKNNHCLLFLIGFTFILSCQAQSSYEGKRLDKIITVEGVERSYIIHVPSNYTGEEEVPLVFMFHGTGGDGERFWRISGWKELAEKEGFIAVFPTALVCAYHDEEDDKDKRKTKWNDGYIETVALHPERLKDDVFFVRTLVEQMENDYKIDSKRIYASGFSNGANFVSRLAVEMSDVFAAVAAASGSLKLEDSEPKELIPYYMIAGAAEYQSKTGEKAPSSATELMRNDFMLARITKARAVFELGESYTEDKGKNHITLIFEDNLGDGDNIYVFSLIRGLEHKYPNGDNNPAGLVAAERFWKFFKQYSK